MKKKRVDILAVRQGLFPTREKAKRAIMAGKVVSNFSGERFDKPGETISEATMLRIKREVSPYVSRGGVKLAKAVKFFDLTLKNKIVLDIGASTGGFTDVALQNGAKIVYALDVGINQLDWKIRQDARIIVMEQINFRYAKPARFTQGLPNIATIDVSFISLRLMFEPLHKILKVDGEVIALIKPQFEVGKDQIGKNGIIYDKKNHKQAIQNVLQSAIEFNFDILKLDFSPITGRKGNIEFLSHLRKSANKGTIAQSINVGEIVDAAHENFSVN
ncbi:MAG: TlyA family RNA methyltransferase [Lactobacillales bacterium]|nr:TlyA family RNA methyltransferase [Lactobacillales bacterium]